MDAPVGVWETNSRDSLLRASGVRHNVLFLMSCVHGWNLARSYAGGGGAAEILRNYVTLEASTFSTVFSLSKRALNLPKSKIWAKLLR